MKVAIIGRSEILYETAVFLIKCGYEIPLIVTAKEAPEYKKTAEDFKALAESIGAIFITTPRIEEIIPILKEMPKLDIGVSINYSGIIPESVISLFSLGILNAHGGDLPRYRGNACQAWAILNGEERVGLCVHSMIGGELDSGNIIARAFFPLTIDTKITQVYQWMENEVPNLFHAALAQLEKNSLFIVERQSKDHQDTLRCYPRRPEDGRIDWNKSALQILRLINASNKPYSGAYCELEGKKIIIWDAEIAPEENFLAIPGQITMIQDLFFDVATSDGKIRIKEAQEEGKEKVETKKYIRSIRQRFN